MSCAVIDRFFRTHAGKKTIDQPGRKTVAAPDTVENLDIFTIDGFIKNAVGPTNGAPVINGSGFNGAQGGSHHFKIGIDLHRFFDHFFKSGGL